MQFNASGFSLIELMVVIALIGILSSLAVPSYRTYVFKSHINEVVAAATTAKTIVAMTAQGNPNLTSLTGACTDFASGGSNTYSVSSTANLSSVSIDPNCNITATSMPLGSSSGPVVTIYVTPTNLNTDGSITWSCTSNSSRYAPSSCQ